MSKSTSSIWDIPRGELTVVIPAHNRVSRCLALLRFLRSCHFNYPIIVVDSSRPDRAAMLREQIGELAKYETFDHTARQYEKFSYIGQAVKTPYIVVLPDDDIAFPHAIEVALGYLRSNSDYVAAQGYSLRFGAERGDFDIYQVEQFVPTVGDEAPMRRYYDLMRRYQPHLWAVFRSETYALAMKSAAPMQGILFQELMFHIVSVLEGKIARLPLIYAMRGPEQSQADYSEVDPFQWFLKNVDTLFDGYAAFRKALISLLLRRSTKYGIAASAGVANYLKRWLGSGRTILRPGRSTLMQTIDLINTTFLGRTLDLPTVNYAVRYALGEVVDPIRFPAPWGGWSEPRPDDLIRSSLGCARRYIWRCEVMNAQPAEEIIIDPAEMDIVEKELDGYDA